MEEGRLALGVWGPLAAAHIYQILVFIATAFARSDSGMKVPSIVDALRAFALPAMAEAMSAEEKESKDRAFVESIKAMAERTGGKVVIK